MKICIVTSGAAAAEPRAMKQGLALKARWPQLSVVLCDGGPRGLATPDPERLAGSEIERSRLDFPTRQNGGFELAARKLQVALAKTRFARFGTLDPALFGVRTFGLTARLRAHRADAYIAHGVDTLLPSGLAAELDGAKLIFDSMEYYADMGDQQMPLDQRAAHAVQTKLLTHCDLVLAASDDIADRLSEDYKIRRPTAVYNTPPIQLEVPARNSEFSLYWRNYQIGFGQRGLEDALVALSLAPKAIKLYIQGRPPHDGGAALSQQLSRLGIADRVIVKPPFPAGQAVSEAAPHTVGLCLERRGPLNHELTVSNKMFDYLMAGLAVVSSDLPSLRKIMERSGAGLMYKPGSPEELAERIKTLYEDSELLETLSENARKFSRDVGNEAVDMKIFTDAVRETMDISG
jgi:glycosyltransferase involved in cell wall biosynthesis